MSADGKPSHGSRETSPPSWSIAMSGGRAASAVSACVSALSSPSVWGMFAPIRMNPPMPVPAMYSASRVGSGVGMCPITTVAALSRVDIAATRADAASSVVAASPATTRTTPFAGSAGVSAGVAAFPTAPGAVMSAAVSRPTGRTNRRRST